MELRQASKNVVQGDVQSAKNANIGATFSTLEKINISNDIILCTWSEMC
jgi:hypothetical protein